MPDTGILGQECLAESEDDSHAAAPLQLSHRIARAGEVVVDICGELDIATAEVAVTYVRNVIDRYRRPVIADLAAVAFCDASGLGGLLRMAHYAEHAGCVFRLACPSPSLIKVMRITRLDRRFLTLHRPPA